MQPGLEYTHRKSIISAAGVEASRDLDDGQHMAQHSQAEHTYIGTAEAIMVATYKAWAAEP